MFVTRPVLGRRRGMASVIAMLYLTLFSTLAVGFYAVTSVSNEVSHNDQQISRAMFAAESGLDFLRYQLSTVVIPSSAKQSDLLQHVYNGLCSQMNGTGNLGTATIGFSGGAIQIPAGNGSIKLTDGSQFSASITQVDANVRVLVTGGFNTAQVNRHVQLDFRLAQNHSPVLDVGLATRGRISMTGGSFIKGATDAKRGNILSTWDATATAITINNSTISGDVSLTNSGGQVTGSGTIGGTNNPAKWPIHEGVGQPEFPTVDTSAFAAYLVGKETVITASSSAPYHKNIRIKKNTNPSFSGTPTIEGVLHRGAQQGRVLWRGNDHRCYRGRRSE
jgi:Tfp pilus assembly protein PilX